MIYLDDVVAFCIIDKLTSSRDKLKSDGTNVSSWLQSLSLFTGTFFRRYPFVEHRGVLQYITHSLQSTNTVDSVNLIVLKELVGSMSGIVVMEDVSKAQLQGRAGGPELVFQSSMFKEMEGSIEKSRRFLAETLMSTPLLSTGNKESFAVTLLVLMAKKLGQIAYETNAKELKLIGNLYDQCHMTLLQLIQFFVVSKIEVHGTRSDLWFVEALPDIQNLLQTYLLDPAIAFSLAQPNFKLLASVAGSDGANKVKTSVVTKLKLYWGHETLSEKLTDFLNPNVLEHLSIDLYLTFWKLSIYDLHFPKSRYETEIIRVESDIEKKRNDSLTSRRAIRKKEDILKKLKSEMAVQEKHVEKTIKQLKGKKEKWVSGAGLNNETIEMFLQHCLVPRLLQGPEDAFYCSLFTKILHDSSTVGWPSLHFYDSILKSIPVMVHCSTEREAASVGLFLSETMASLQNWCMKDKYEKHCSKKEGFRKNFADHESEIVDHDFYLKCFETWNKRLTKVFSAALSGNVYLTVRNTLVVLSKVVHEYPNDKKTMTKMVNVVGKLIETEKKADVKTVAKQYGVMLQKRKREDPTLDANPPKKKVTRKEYNFDNDQNVADKSVINNNGDKNFRNELMSPDAKTFKPETGSSTTKDETEDGEVKQSNTEIKTNLKSFQSNNNRKRPRWNDSSSNSNGATGGRRWGNDGNGDVSKQQRRNSGGWDRRGGDREPRPARNTNINKSRWSEGENKKNGVSSEALPQPPARPTSSMSEKSRSSDDNRRGNKNIKDNGNTNNNNKREGRDGKTAQKPPPPPPPRPSSSMSEKSRNNELRRWRDGNRNDSNDANASNNNRDNINAVDKKNNSKNNNSKSNSDGSNNNNNRSFKRKRGSSPPSSNNGNSNKRVRVDQDSKPIGSFKRHGGTNNRNRGGNRNGGGGGGRNRRR